MCEKTDWMDEIDRLKFALESITELLPHGSYLRENVGNITRGIEARLDWILAEAKRECNRPWGKYAVKK
jgi:hypothetical protein